MVNFDKGRKLNQFPLVSSRKITKKKVSSRVKIPTELDGRCDFTKNYSKMNY